MSSQPNVSQDMHFITDCRIPFLFLLVSSTQDFHPDNLKFNVGLGVLRAPGPWDISKQFLGTQAVHQPEPTGHCGCPLHPRLQQNRLLDQRLHDRGA